MGPPRVIIPDGSAASAVRLGEWIAEHGPLAPASAFLIGLDTCARVSRLPARPLGSAVQALSITHVARNPQGGWTWTPPLSNAAPRVVTDAEITERVGALMWHSLTGTPVTDPYAADEVLRGALRAIRPDVPALFVEVTVRAVSARSRPYRPLAALASDIRQALGLEAPAPPRASSRARRLGAIAAAGVSLLIAIAWTAGTSANDRIEEHGLTGRETEIVDVVVETAQSLALVDEHTAAIQEFQDIGERLRARLVPLDPRLVWNWAHEAWVRHLAGDRLTTEQLLEGAPEWLARELGDTHPYTRAARLSLAAVLDERGAAAEATALRARADAATHELLEGRVVDVATGLPVAPGVIAHVAPNNPIREGFRRSSAGGYFAPLTSAQRLNAEKHGWRLHIVARDTCRVSAVVGNFPRRVSAVVVRGARNWELQIEGVTPGIALQSDAANTVVTSLAADASGEFVASFDGRKAAARLAPTSPTPIPPHTVTFDGASAQACAVVWLEIPFPFAPTGR